MAGKTVDYQAGWVDFIHKDRGLSKQQKEAAIAHVYALRLCDYIPKNLWPSSIQSLVLLRNEEELLVAGQRRGGKTVGMLMDAVRDTVHEDFKAIFLRATLGELTRTGGIVDTLKKWLSPYPEWVWTEDKLEYRNKRTNAALVCAYLGQKGDEDKQLFGFEYGFIGLEELTRFPFTPDWNPYPMMFSSLNVPPGSPIIPRLRATSNPGGSDYGEEWVMNVFLSPDARRIDIPDTNGSYMLVQQARPSDNPEEHFGGICMINVAMETNIGMDAPRYRARLLRMRAQDPVAYAQLGEGKWGVKKKGGVFDADKIIEVPFPPPQVIAQRRGWDKAGTQGGDGPRSAGVLIARIPKGKAREWYGNYVSPTVDLSRREFVIVHVVAGRWSADQREDNIDVIAGGGFIRSDDGTQHYWRGDGSDVHILHEQEPGSGGKQSAEITTNRLIGNGFIARHQTATGDKEHRAAHMAAAVNNDMYLVVYSDGSDGSISSSEIKAEFRRFNNKAQVIDIVDGGDIAHNDMLHISPGAAPTVGAPRTQFTNLRTGVEGRGMGPIRR